MRTPLRPLARILEARSNGENPDLIERENLARRHDAMREKTQPRASARLGLLALAFGRERADLLRLLILEPERPLAEGARERFAEYVARRALGEPTARCTGGIATTNSPIQARWRSPTDNCQRGHQLPSALVSAGTTRPARTQRSIPRATCTRKCRSPAIR